VNEMAITQTVILKSFKEEFANFLVNTYQAIGVGNSTLEATPNSSPLLGSAKVYKSAYTGIEEINSTVRVRWESDLIRGDLFSDTVSEVAIVKNSTNGRNDGFVRLLIDPFTIGEKDTLRISLEVEI